MELPNRVLYNLRPRSAIPQVKGKIWREGCERAAEVAAWQSLYGCILRFSFLSPFSHLALENAGEVGGWWQCIQEGDLVNGRHG